MNNITYFKKFICLMLLCGFVLIPLCSCQKKYSYPISYTDYHGELYLPQYVPLGYEFKSLESASSLSLITYSSPNDDLCFVQINSQDHTISLDTEHNNVTEYKSEKYSGYLLTDKNIESSHLIYVYNDTHTFEIFGIIEKNELFKMVESIEKYNP